MSKITASAALTTLQLAFENSGDSGFARALLQLSREPAIHALAETKEPSDSVRQLAAAINAKEPGESWVKVAREIEAQFPDAKADAGELAKKASYLETSKWEIPERKLNRKQRAYRQQLVEAMTLIIKSATESVRKEKTGP